MVFNFMKILIIEIFLFLLPNIVNASNSSKYNVVLIVFDDLRPTIGAYGDRLAQTPHLDAFIHRSFYFTRTYSQVNCKDFYF